MSSSDSWSRFVNEKLYLASLQIEVMNELKSTVSRESASSDDCALLMSEAFLSYRAKYLSSFWAAIAFIGSAYEGVLSEIAEFHQFRESVNSLSGLGNLIGTEKREYVRLFELSNADNSWLWLLLSLKQFFSSPSSRVSFSGDKTTLSDNKIETAAETKNISTPENIIATSSSESGSMTKSWEVKILPCKSEWHLTELTTSMLQRIIDGLKDFNNEIRACAQEW